MAKQIHDRKRKKIRGRSSDHTFLRLPHYVIRSPQWRALGGHAIKFLVELACEYDGSNNGDLSLTRGQARRCGWRSGATRDRAAEEAIAAGFALLTRQGGRHVCNLYAVTWEPIDDVGKSTMYPPSHKALRLWEKREGIAHSGANVAPIRGKQ